jgi:hypothetical protein
VERQVFKGRQAYSAIKPSAEPADPTVDVKTLHAKIGKLTLENDVFSVRPAKLLGLSRGAFIIILHVQQLTAIWH